MAERSSELEPTGMTVAEGETTEILVEKRREDYSLAETDDRDTEIAATEMDATDDASDDAQQIREQIEETRSQMSETIDAIQEKLSIANITEQVKEQVSEQIGGAVETAKDAFFGKTSEIAKTVGKSLGRIGDSDLAKKAQENPWIISVVGMGIGAILAGALFGDGKSKRKVKQRNKKFDDDNRRIERKSPIVQNRRKFNSGETFESDHQTASHVKPQPDQNRVAEAANTAYESVGSAASTAFAGVSSAAGSAYETVGSAAGKTYESVGQASSYAYEKAGDLGEEMKKSYEHYIEENPLVVGAVAFAVGAAIGYAIPSTKVENQYLGEVRDNVLEKAQASAQDAIGSVKQVVGEAQQLIVDEVKSQTAS